MASIGGICAGLPVHSTCFHNNAGCVTSFNQWICAYEVAHRSSIVVPTWMRGIHLCNALHLHCVCQKVCEVCSNPHGLLWWDPSPAAMCATQHTQGKITLHGTHHVRWPQCFSGWKGHEPCISKVTSKYKVTPAFKTARQCNRTDIISNAQALGHKLNKYCNVENTHIVKHVGYMSLQQHTLLNHHHPEVDPHQHVWRAKCTADMFAHNPLQHFQDPNLCTCAPWTDTHCTHL